MVERRRARPAVVAAIALALTVAGLSLAPAVRAVDTLNPDDIDAAGCLIATPDGFVMGVNRLINRLQLPAGRHLAGESARQTAARETLEETGLAVEVGEVALRLDERRVVFFFCRAIDRAADFAALKPTDRVEVSRAMVVNPVTMTTPNGELIETPWRFPQMHWLLRSLFASVSAPTAD